MYNESAKKQRETELKGTGTGPIDDVQFRSVCYENPYSNFEPQSLIES